MEYKTFKEWSAAGYKINKGAKAVWINNEPHFGRDQVNVWPYRSDRRTRRYYQNNVSSLQGGQTDYDFDREEDSELADFYGISPWGGD